MPDNLTFDPVISVPLIAGIGAVLAVVVIFSYLRAAREVGWFRKSLLLTIRLTALGALLVILLRPMAMEPQKEAGRKLPFTVLVDDSASMNTPDAAPPDAAEKTRYQATLEALRAQAPEMMRELGRNYDVKFYRFSEDLRRTSLDELAAAKAPQGKRTRIAGALLDSVRDAPLAAGGKARRHGGVLLISDGRDNDRDSWETARGAARHLRALRIPVWTAAVGAATETKDLTLRARLSSNFLFVSQPAALQVEVTGSGYADWYARVNLYREGKYVTSQEVRLRNGRASLFFPLEEERKGVYQYRAEVEPLAGEADEGNNRRSVIARVVDERTQVLVVEGRPYWDSKFLLRALRRDPNLDVTAIFNINARKTFAIAERTSEEDLERRTVSEGIHLPRTREELYKYDCIFIGKDIDAALSVEELKRLRDYLTERGGSIVFFRGKSYTGEQSDLAALEPVVWDTDYVSDVRFELTSQGRSSPIFDFAKGKGNDVIVKELPEMVSITKIREEKSLAVVLAKGGKGEGARELAAIAYQRFGKGKVMSVAATGLWRWAFIPEEQQEYDGLYQRFWGQTIRWLIADSDFLPGRDISFRLDKYSYLPGEPVRLTILTKLVDAEAYKPRIELVGPDGNTAWLTPETDEGKSGVYSAFYTPELEGEYRAVLHNNVGEPSEDATRFTVYEDSVERRCVAADRELMALLAADTGGRTLELERLRELPAQVRRFETLTRERAKPRDVWDQMSIFMLLMGAFGLEWFIRRASGMV